MSATFERHNPVTGEVASRAAAMKAGDIPAVAVRAQQGFATWSKMGPNARRAVLMKAADALMAKKDEFVAAMMGEIGATAGWAMFNLGLAAGMVREAAALTTQISGEVIPSDHEGTVAMALREPVGVMLGIAPWNAPIILGVRAIAVPLACGNSVILKASENCPRTHELIIEAFAEAGFPEGVVNSVTNAPEDAADGILAAPLIRGIARPIWIVLHLLSILFQTITFSEPCRYRRRVQQQRDRTGETSSRLAQVLPVAQLIGYRPA